MAVSAINFPFIQPQVSDPLGTALQSALKSYGTIQQLQQQRVKNKYLPDMLQAQLQSALLGNKSQEITNQYLPNTLQAKLAQMQSMTQGQNLQNQFYPGHMNAEIGELLANTGLTREKTKIAPMDQIIEAQRALNDMASTQNSASRFNSPAYQITRILGTPEGEQLMSNPEFARAASQIMANTPNELTNMNSSQRSGTNILPQFQKSFMGGIQLQNPEQNNTLMGSQTSSQQPNLSPEDIGGVQDIALSHLIKKTLPPQIQMQRYYSNSAHNLFDQIDPYIKSIASYAGAGGQAKKSLGRYAASISPEASKQYEEFKVATDRILPVLANDLRRAFGDHATDQQIKAMEKLTKFDYWDSNFPLALKEYQGIKDSLNSMDKSTIQSLNETAGQLRKGINGSSNNIDVRTQYQSMTPEEKRAFREKYGY